MIFTPTNFLVLFIQTSTCLIDEDLNADWLFLYNKPKATRSLKIITNGRCFNCGSSKFIVYSDPRDSILRYFHHACAWRVLCHHLFIDGVTPDQLFCRLDHFQLSSVFNL